MTKATNPRVERKVQAVVGARLEQLLLLFFMALIPAIWCLGKLGVGRRGDDYSMRAWVDSWIYSWECCNRKANNANVCPGPVAGTGTHHEIVGGKMKGEKT
jgi:hypothetical protein